MDRLTGRQTDIVTGPKCLRTISACNDALITSYFLFNLFSAEDDFDGIYDDVPKEFLLSKSQIPDTNNAIKGSSSGAQSQASDIIVAPGIKSSHPPDYTVLHFESKHDSKNSSNEPSVINGTPLLAPLSHSTMIPAASVSTGAAAASSTAAVAGPPPVPPHAVDHSTYEAVGSPVERRLRSQESEQSTISIDSGYGKISFAN